MDNRLLVWWLLLSFFIALSVISLPAQSLGQDEKTNGNIRFSAERDFAMYCATCHGEDGRGEGVKTYVLSKLPPDLTKLSVQNNGTLPRERIVRFIDGREDVNAHEDRDMPAWGDWFKMEAGEGLGGAEGDEDTVKRRIDDLVDLLEDMQGK